MKKLLLALFLIFVSPICAQLDFHETFEGGATIETWVNTPTVIVNAATLTGSYYLDPPNALYIAEDGLNSAEEWWSFQYRPIDTPGAVSTHLAVLSQVDGNDGQCDIRVSTGLKIQAASNGASTVDSTETLSTGTNYIIEVHAKQGSGANAECQFRIDGGSWQGPTTGTDTDAIGAWRIRGGTTHDRYYDEYKRCAAGAVGDSACGADIIAPAPGNSGTITTGNIGRNSLDLTCTVGTDAVTAQANLEYEFRQSSTNNMGSVANAEANGSIIRAYTANDCTHTATGLLPNTLYWFQVIIRDAALNKAIYTQKSQATAGSIRIEAGVIFPHFPKTGSYRILPPVFSDATEGIAYVSETPSVILGKPDYVWSVVGTLPPGLAIASATGVVSGTPTTEGIYNYTLKTVDANSGIAILEGVSIQVLPGTPPGGSLDFFEDAEDGLDFLTDGGCSATANGFLEGADEIAKTTSTDCVLVDNIDEPEIWRGFDFYRDGAAAPDTNRYQVVVGLDSAGNVLFQFGVETDWDLFAFTPGQTTFGGRGFFLGNLLTPDTSKYIEIHYLKGTGTNALWEVRVDGSNLQTFSAGTATTNVDRIIIRNENDDATQDFFFDRFSIKDDEFPGLGPLCCEPEPPPTPQPWIDNFTPIRTHYIDDVACGGSGTLASPECLADAGIASHYTAGDLHIFRTGVWNLWTIFSGDWKLIEDCSLANPCVWMAFYSATGQPERAELNGSTQSSPVGAHHWFVGLNKGGIGGSQNGPMETRDDGTHSIHVIYDECYGTCMKAWDGGPGQKFYGNVVSSTVGTDPGFNTYFAYTNNNFNNSGWKYWLMNIVLSTPAFNEYAIHAYTQGGWIEAMHFEKNFFLVPLTLVIYFSREMSQVPD